MVETTAYSMALLFENHANSLQVAASLKEKEIDVHVVASAGELIQSIVNHKLDLVALSVNHPSTTGLVQVLKVKTKVSILVFGEEQTKRTAESVLRTSADHQVTGAITSYNIWLKIGHLVREKQKMLERAQHVRTQPIENNESALIIKSSSKKKKMVSADNISIVKSYKSTTANNSTHTESQGDNAAIFGQAGARNNLQKQRIKTRTNNQDHDNEPSEHHDDENNNEEFGDLISQLEQGQKDSHGNIAMALDETQGNGKADIHFSESIENGRTDIYYDPQKAKKSKDADVNEQDQEIGEMAKVFFNEQHNNFDPHMDQTEHKKQGALLQKETTSDLAVPLEQLHSAEQHGTTLDRGYGKSNDENSNELDISQNMKSEGAVSSYEETADKTASIEAARQKSRKYKKSKERKENLEAEKESVGADFPDKFKKAFQAAVEKAGETGFKKTDRQAKTGNVSRVSLIPIESCNERGFLIVKGEKTQHVIEQELEKFKDELSLEMNKVLSVEVNIGETIDVETNSFELSSWAEKGSQFYYTFESPSSGEQVFICFLQKENMLPHAQKIDGYDMHRVALQIVEPNEAVVFDAYLYLQKNEKMLPYLKTGGWLTSKQVDRLYSRGLKFLYIRDEQISKYYSFYISRSLNQDLGLEKKPA